MPVSHLAKRAKIQRIPRDWSLLHFIYNLLYAISHFLEQYCNHCFKWTNSQDTILLHPLYCKNVKQLNPLLYKHLEQRSNVIHPTCCQLIKVFVPQIPQPFTKPWRSAGVLFREKNKSLSISPYLIYATVPVALIQWCHFKLHIYPRS